MPSRTPFTAVSLAKYNATDHAKMPKGCIAYASSATSSTGITTETDLTDLSVTVTIGADRLIVIEVYVPRVSSLTASDIASLRIKESATDLQEARLDVGTVVSGSNGGAVGLARTAPFTPSAGSHTYKATGGLAQGTGTLQFRAGATTPSFIMVTDVGPSF